MTLTPLISAIEGRADLLGTRVTWGELIILPYLLIFINIVFVSKFWAMMLAKTSNSS